MCPRVGLDKATIVEAAAALADEQGIEQLSLATLASHLNVRTPSLYNHISGLEGLRRELALLGVRELTTRTTRATVGKSTDDAVLALGLAYRAFAQERPGLYNASLRAPTPDDLALQAASRELLEILQAVLAGYGLKEEASLHAIRGFRSVVHGFVSLEINGGFGMALDRDESFRYLLQVFINGLHAPPKI